MMDRVEIQYNTNSDEVESGASNLPRQIEMRRARHKNIRRRCKGIG